jgi:cyclic pyranopterin phosphate synthase
MERVRKGGPDCVAQHWRYLDGRGELGLIASVTEPFCSGCDRARLSADGALYTCLFASSGLDLKGFLRGGASDAELAALLEARWKRRDDRYSELRGEATRDLPRAEMFHLGG